MTLLFALSMTGAWADNYDYLVIVTQKPETSATQFSMESMGLTLTFANGYMVLTPAEGEAKRLPIDELHMMYFSDTAVGGEIELPTLIEKALVEMERTEVDVYGTDGSYCGRFDNLKTAQSTLQRGVYLIRNNNKTVKIEVK